MLSEKEQKKFLADRFGKVLILKKKIAQKDEIIRKLKALIMEVENDKCRDTQRIGQEDE